MKRLIYSVKIPIPNTEEYKETTFNTREEACEFLNITIPTMYALERNKLKYIHANKKHLNGIIVESYVAPKQVKPKVKKVKKIDPEQIKQQEDSRNEFFDSLIKKII